MNPDVLGEDEGFVDQQAELVEDLELLGAGSRCDPLGGIDVEAAHECAEPAKQDALGFGQQCVRPVHGGTQGLLAAQHVSGAAGQQSEPVVEAVGDLPTDSARTRAAANSIASGMPSSRRQMSATDGVLVTAWNVGLARCARSVNSAMASSSTTTTACAR